MKHYIDLSNIDYEHKDLTESPEVQSFLLDVITATSATETTPDEPIYSDSLLLIGLHSPMEMVLIDESERISGFQNGEIHLDIPNTTYRELAGAQYITISKEDSFTVSLQGVANGGATLTIDEFSGSGESNAIAALPIAVVSTSTQAIIKYDQTFTDLQIDEDGDGIIDSEVGLDGEVVDDEEVSYENLREQIRQLAIGHKAKWTLLRTLARVETYSQKDTKRANKLERRSLRFLKFQLRFLYKRGKITVTEFQELEEQINKLISDSKL